MMGKKNNKKISPDVILITFVIIGLIVLFAVLFIPTLKPRFTIYEEVCENETWEYSGYNCSDGTVHVPPYFDELEIENYTHRNGIFCFKIHEGFNSETCNQIEVDELKICNPVTCIEGGGCGCPIQIIPKQDLTTEWLDENCGCIERLGEESCNKLFYGRTKNYCKNSNYCSKYSCSSVNKNYTVEVE